VISIATPVRCRDASAIANIFSPTAGSCTTIPLRVISFSTTKWFMSQCTTAGSRNWRRLSRSNLSGRQDSCSCSAICISALSVTPFIDTGKRRRRVFRSTR
jgi:hypothetical protein